VHYADLLVMPTRLAGSLRGGLIAA